MKIYRQNRPLSALACCLFFISSCNATDNAPSDNTPMKEISIRSHYSSNQCAINSASVTLINDKTALDAIIANSRRSVLSNTAPALSEINFAQNRVLLIALGDKSSAGYGIKLTGDSAKIHDAKLILPVEIITPEKGSMQAQVITSPCMIVSFTKGDYTRVIVNETLGLQLER